MAVKTRLPLFILLLLLSLFSLFLAVALAKEDPEQKQCRHQCKHQPPFTPQQQLQCERRCEDHLREDKVGWDVDSYYDRERLKECWERCERQGQGERCRERCESRFGRRREEEFGSGPYVFEKHEFVTKVETEHGRVGVLPRFGERSNLLRGIDDFRLGFLDIDPHAFLGPHHFDADSLLFVVEGRGTITVLKEDKKDHINFEEGDVVRIRAGSPVYFVNGDSNVRLRIANLLKPINAPGHVELYHGTSGEDRKSFYSAFSLDVLEAALKTDRRSLEEMFGQRQQQPAVVLGSKEQIEALSGGNRSKSSSHAFNIFDKKPSKSNQFGQLREVDVNDFVGLKDLDVRVTFVNITLGAMIGPYFNSRATVISVLTEGKGYLEMACPYEGQTYETVRSRVEQGMVFIVPAGHPVVTLASENDNLKILFYEVNAENNIRYPLAGKNNIVSLMDKEAKELAFDYPSREVDGAFSNQEEELFFARPSRRRQQGPGPGRCMIST